MSLSLGIVNITQIQAPLPPQPTVPNSSLPRAGDKDVQAFVAFSFSQGDAASFNQVCACIFVAKLHSYVHDCPIIIRDSSLSRKLI